MAEHETTADIIAWLRKPREGENAYLTLWRDEIADRLEAAHKRERGDCAKLREAAESALIVVRGILDDTLARRNQSVFDCRDKLKSALAAPARNCDIYATVEEARKVWCGTPSRDWDYLCDWLYAPATEKEGESDGSK